MAPHYRCTSSCAAGEQIEKHVQAQRRGYAEVVRLDLWLRSRAHLHHVRASKVLFVMVWTLSSHPYLNSKFGARQMYVDRVV